MMAMSKVPVAMRWGDNRVRYAFEVAFFAILCALLAVCAYPVSARADEGLYLIELESGDGGGIAHASEDLFAHIPDMEPGKSYAGKVEIKNSSERDVTAFICVDEWVGDDDVPAVELLDRVRLSLAYGDSSVYEGPIRATDMRDEHDLGELGPGASGFLAYEISLASDMPDALYGLDNAVRWHIGFREAADDADSGKDDLRGADLSQTGDGAPLLLAVLTFAVLISVACMFVVLVRSKREVCGDDE